jgi:hypothetical protein
MKNSFEQANFENENELGPESGGEEMPPIEGPLLELAHIHFTSEQIERVADLFERNGFSLKDLPPMGEAYARDTLIPLITEYLEATDAEVQKQKEKEIIEAL